jgi:hypothetical protein
MRPLMSPSGVKICLEGSNVAEPANRKKISLRDIMDEIAEDESMGEQERRRAMEISLELEYQEWKTKQTKLTN